MKIWLNTTGAILTLAGYVLYYYEEYYTALAALSIALPFWVVASIIQIRKWIDDDDNSNNSDC